MSKPRIIIADTDERYIMPLQLKFAEEHFDQVEIEVITDEMYYEELFTSPQKADILVVSENLYSTGLMRHNIDHIFVMMEQYDEIQTQNLSVIRLFKYTNINDIYHKIVVNSADVLQIQSSMKKDCQIIVVYSACGGVGKTTLSLGMSLFLAKNYKRVLYINAERLQSFQRMLENQSAITSLEVYLKLGAADEHIYPEIKSVIRKEVFHYLPPFKASLMSLGLPYSIFETIAYSAKLSNEYDYIIIDTDTVFDEYKAKLLSAADKVVIITRQDRAVVYATNVLVKNISGVDSEKYIFICNDFDKEKDNEPISSLITAKYIINDYIKHFEHYDHMTCEDFSQDSGIQKISFLLE